MRDIYAELKVRQAKQQRKEQIKDGIQTVILMTVTFITIMLAMICF
jgi:hypothetical protein